MTKKQIDYRPYKDAVVAYRERRIRKERFLFDWKELQKDKDVELQEHLSGNSHVVDM